MDSSSIAADKLPYLELIFNNFYNDLFFPENWSVSTIRLISKTGDQSKVNRGICLQPVISKKILKESSNENDIIGEEQAGYRKSYSTVDHLFCLQTVVAKNLRNKGGRLLCSIY